MKVDLRNGGYLLFLLDTLWEVIKGFDGRRVFNYSSSVSLVTGLVMRKSGSHEQLHTTICAQRVTWNIVTALWVPSDATQHHGRCPSAHCNLRFKICNIRVCLIVKDGRGVSMVFFFGTEDCEDRFAACRYLSKYEVHAEQMRQTRS